MKDEQKRFGKGFAVALAVHLVLAAGLGIFGYRFVHTPPEILEVSLEAGGGGADRRLRDCRARRHDAAPERRGGIAPDSSAEPGAGHHADRAW